MKIFKIDFIIDLSNVSNSPTKFGWISSDGLGRDSITDGRTDAITISPSLFFEKRGDNNMVSDYFIFMGSICKMR